MNKQAIVERVTRTIGLIAASGRYDDSHNGAIDRNTMKIADILTAAGHFDLLTERDTLTTQVRAMREALEGLLKYIMAENPPDGMGVKAYVAARQALDTIATAETEQTKPLSAITTLMQAEADRQQKRLQALEKVAEAADRYNNVFEQMTGWYIQPESVSDLMFSLSTEECKRLWKLHGVMSQALADLDALNGGGE